MTDVPLLVPVVEGEGEGEGYAVHVLLRRICSELLDVHHVEVRTPWRLARPKMVKPGEVERVAQVVARASLTRRGGVLVLLDQDDDECPVHLAQEVGRLFGTVSHLEVVVARREFEAWFLAGATSLRRHRSVIDSAHFDADPESPRDAKGRLRHLMTEPYRETLHQASFCASLDLLAAADRSRSFRRLVSAVGQLVGPEG